MKKIIILISCFIFFTACSSENSLTNSSSNSTDLSINSNSSNVNDSEEIKIDDSFFSDETNYGYFGKLSDENLEIVNSSLNNYFDNIISSDDSEMLLEYDITVSASNIIKTSNDTFDFTLNIKSNNGNRDSIIIPSLFQYNEDFLDFDIYWGFFSMIDNQLFIITSEKIIIYNITDLSKTEIAIPKINNEKIYPRGIVSFEDYYTIAYYQNHTAGYINLDLNGNILASSVLNLYDDNYYYNNYNFSFDFYIFNTNLKYSNNENLFFPIGTYGNLTYFNLETNAVYDCNIRYEGTTSNDKNILIFFNNDTYKFTINVYDEKALINSHSFSNSDIANNFENIFTIGTTTTTYENNILSLVSDFDEGDMRLDIDFSNKTESVDFTFDNFETNFNDRTTYSNDKRYSFQYPYSFGAGDAFYSYVVVFNSLTNQNTYIGLIGGMYGGGSDLGFFSNNDAYLMGRTSFKIFSESQGFKEVLDLRDTLDLGYKGEGETDRCIFSVRRDPVSYEFIVLYADIDSYNTDETYFLSSTYKIGFLNSNGELVESFDTTQNVGLTNFGLTSVDMYLKDSTLYFEGYHQKGGAIFAGEFNINTKTYTDTTPLD